MKKNHMADMKSISYSCPEAIIQEIRFEGVLCSSPMGSSAADMTLGDPLTDYEQIN